MLCDTHSVSSSTAFTVTLVSSHERHAAAVRVRRVMRQLASLWRLVPGRQHGTAMTFPVAGIAPPDRPAGGSSPCGVRRIVLPVGDDFLDAVLLMPDAPRWVS